MTVKIGVDARSLSRPLTGIGRYTLEMCRQLLVLPNVSLFLYSPSRFRDDNISGLCGAHFFSGNSSGPITEQLWMEFVLPLQVRRDNLDVFWGAAHRLPAWMPSGLSCVVTIHDLVWLLAPETMPRFSRLLERWKMPRALGRADWVVADSQATATSLNKYLFVSENKMDVIYLGSSLPKSTSGLECISVKKPYILFVGTLEPRKNLAGLLQSYAALSKKTRKRAQLVIVGGKGWGGVDLSRLIEDLSLQGDVLVLGYVEENLLASLYRHALFLAMPSLYEGFGLPLLESMTYGVPVLAAHNSSMPEVVADAGILVDASDCGSISAGLEALINNEEKRLLLSANALRNAKRFSWHQSSIQLMSVFERAIVARDNNTGE